MWNAIDEIQRMNDISRKVPVCTGSLPKWPLSKRDFNFNHASFWPENVSTLNRILEKFETTAENSDKNRVIPCTNVMLRESSVPWYLYLYTIDIYSWIDAFKAEKVYVLYVEQRNHHQLYWHSIIGMGCEYSIQQKFKRNSIIPGQGRALLKFTSMLGMTQEDIDVLFNHFTTVDQHLTGMIQ